MSDLHLDGSLLSRIRGRAAVTVNGNDAYGRHAFSAGDLLRYSFFFPRTLGVTGGLFSVTIDGGETVFSAPLSFARTEGDEDVFFVMLDTEGEGLSAHLYFCHLTVDTPFGMLGVYGGNDLHFEKKVDRSVFQLILYRYTHPQTKWLYGGCIYHVFVDRFFRGGNAPLKEGAVLNEDWENGLPQYPDYPGAPLANNMFFGGDLYGVIAKLPHIASLGAKAIYLSPIFRAASNHKYDTGDYAQVDEMFGGEEALATLIDKATTYGIRIILDGVFNHTGDDSLYFNRYGRYDSIGAYQSRTSPYASWYTFTDFPNKYEAWWGIEILPKLNLHDAACRAYFLGDDGIIAKYARMGIGGMRLDVADELDGAFIAAIKNRLCEVRSDAVLYGEVWEDASNKIAYGRRTGYYLGEQLDGVMNYPLRTGILQYLREKKTEALSYYFGEVLPNMPKRAADTAMNFLGTHDTVRVLTALGGESAEGKSNKELSTLRMGKTERKNAVQLLKGAYLILATLPGIPSVYYGDEVGMEGYSDPFNRMPFPWHCIEEELLSHYQKMGEIRTLPMYADGELVLLHLDETLLAFSREKDGKAALTLFNNSENERRIAMPAEAELLLGEVVSGELVIPPFSGALALLNKGSALALSL